MRHRIEVTIEREDQEALARGAGLELTLGDQAVLLRFEQPEKRRGRRPRVPKAEPVVRRPRRRRNAAGELVAPETLVTDGSLVLKKSRNAGKARPCNYCKRDLAVKPHSPKCRVWLAQQANAERAAKQRAAANAE